MPEEFFFMLIELGFGLFLRYFLIKEYITII
jgi:hypothetical protein